MTFCLRASFLRSICGLQRWTFLIDRNRAKVLVAILKLFIEFHQAENRKAGDGDKLVAGVASTSNAGISSANIA